LEAAWTKVVAASPAFDFLKDAAEDVYTAADGKPFHDQGKNAVPTINAIDSAAAS
jgi:hypothetical protein